MNGPLRLEGCGEEERESCLFLAGTEFQVGKMNKVLKTDSGDGCTVGMYFMPRNCTLKNGKNGKYYIYFTTIKVAHKKKIQKRY